MNGAAPRGRFDVVIVGGGIHGAGVLQACAAAGWTTLLVEERGIASGTSSRSSKLVHGGLRYLETRQFSLVRESLHERRILLDVARELVQLVPFHIPVYGRMRRRPWQVRAGLSLYALLGDLRREARFESLPRRSWGELDGLTTADLRAVFRYRDGQTDDAQLTRAVVHSAEELGAVVACPARFLRARRGEDGFEIELQRDGQRELWQARTLVNAAGPWVNLVRERIDPRPPGMDVDLVGGTHLELEGTLARGIYYAEAPRDGRAVFLMPWHGHLLVGTTETPYGGDPRLVRPLPEEVEYLRETLLACFPAQQGRLLDSWAGLRVLPRGRGRAFDRPRETTLLLDDVERPRMLAIYGGKLTGYRATAHKVFERLSRTLPARPRLADTATLRLRAPANPRIEATPLQPAGP